jgi:3',5'-cyclic-AMP phosphodiesterase
LTHQPNHRTAAADALTLPSRPLRLVQVTDPHLFAAAEGHLLGLNTRRSFAAVLDLALDRGQPTDALVLTGDLVHDETAAGYAWLAAVLAQCGCPTFCIPGNHDRRALMETWLGTAAGAPLSDRRLGAWRLIFLDSTQPGQEGGRLAGHQLRGLDALLRADSAPALIFLHQHPLPVGSAWIDTMGVANGDQLLAVCDRHPHLRALVCGHIHQEFAACRRHYQVLGTPSTCLQFMPGSAEFALDSSTPGYRELRLHPDGRLDTWVERLAEYPEPLVLSTTGY